MTIKKTCVGVMCLLVCAMPAAASMIELSTDSSDETDPAWLSATLDFSVEASTLTLTVTNDTVAPHAYSIKRVYFNANGSGVDLTLDSSPDGWELLTEQAADGFGTFDFAVLESATGQLATIPAGQAAVFTFSMLGTAVEGDFVLGTSEGGMIAAAKFVIGPGDDGAFGAHAMPEPGTLALLLAAGLFVGTRRRRAA